MLCHRLCEIKHRNIIKVRTMDVNCQKKHAPGHRNGQCKRLTATSKASLSHIVPMYSHACHSFQWQCSRDISVNSTIIYYVPTGVMSHLA